MPGSNNWMVNEADSRRFDPQHADVVVASDLNKMTAEQRDVVFDDVHGVRSLRAEESIPNKLLDAIEQMSIAIDKIEPKAAFNNARQLDSQYVLRDKQFRVRFLRAEEFDVQKAAQRFINYLEFYHELFGVVALMRPIYFDDLNKDEQCILKGGCEQLLPCRDRTGRRILCRIGNMKDPEEAQITPSVRFMLLSDNFFF